jgi:hypothetical protein
MKKTFLIVLVFVFGSFTAKAQDFSFQEMENPDNNEETISRVLLLGNQAFAGGANVNLYYDGSGWNKLSPSRLESISGIEKPDGEIYALHFANHQPFYRWNDNAKIWQTINKPEGIDGLRGTFVKSENITYFCQFTNDNYGEIWFYDGSSFQKRKSDFYLVYTDIWVKDQSNIFLMARTPGEGSFLYRYNDIEQELSLLHTFPSDRGIPKGIHSYDNNIFFITIDSDVYKWNDEEETMEDIRLYSEGEQYYYNDAVFATDENNIFVAGWSGLLHINLEAGTEQNIYSGGKFRDASVYENRVFLVGDNGIIVEMLIGESSSNEDIRASLKLSPNPVEDVLRIELPVLGLGTKEVEIFNSLGQVVLHSSFSSLETSLDLSALARGIYFVRVSEGKNVLTIEKIIKK